jgi:hypothetical protein
VCVSWTDEDADVTSCLDTLTLCDFFLNDVFYVGIVWVDNKLGCRRSFEEIILILREKRFLGCKSMGK